jgi:hypothetical protein
MRAAILVGVALALVCASAATAQQQETNSFEALKQRLAAAQKDDIAAYRSLAISRPYEPADCLQLIIDEMGIAQDQLAFMDVLMTAGLSMESKPDQTAIRRLVAYQAIYGLKIIEITRDEVNAVAAQCGENSFIVSRAQRALVNLDDEKMLFTELK